MKVDFTISGEMVILYFLVFGQLYLKAYQEQLLMSGVPLTQTMETELLVMHAMEAMVGALGYWIL